MELSRTRIFDFFRHYIGGLYRRVGEDHVFLLGGGLAFSIIICIVPFVLIIIYLLGMMLESSSVNYQINLLVDTLIPYLEYSDYVKGIIHSRADEVIAYKNIAGYIGAIGLLFAASGLFSSMRTGLGVIFKIPEDRPGYVGKLKDIGMVLLVVVFFLLSTAILPVFEIIKDSAEKVKLFKDFELTSIEGKLFFIMSLLTIFILFHTLYSLIPHRRPGWKVSAVGAFWAALLWTIAKEVFGYYITNVASMKRIYGTYMLFAVVNFWIYYTSIIFLIGAQIAQLYKERISDSVRS